MPRFICLYYPLLLEFTKYIFFLYAFNFVSDAMIFELTWDSMGKIVQSVTRFLIP